MSMKRQYENNGKTFWEDIDATMRRTAEQYKEAIKIAKIESEPEI